MRNSVRKMDWIINFIFMVCILQWNARSLVANGQELKKLVRDSETKPDLICVQETWLQPHLDFIIPGYVGLRRDRIRLAPSGGGGGCAIFVKSGIQYKVCECESLLECQVIEVWSPQGKISVINYYNPCEQLVLSELEAIVSRIRTPVIWTGDFNAHNPLWGSQGKDANGTVVEDLLDNINLVIMNDGSATRYDVNTLKMSCLDLTLASPVLARVGEWRVLEEESMGSDHFPILCTFGRSLTMEAGGSVSRFDFSRAKWEEFESNIGENLEFINSEGSIDDYNDSLSEVILNAALESIPCRGVPKERVIVPWWNSDCDKAVKKRNLAFRTLRRNITQENVIYFKQCRASARRTIKEAKKNCWRTFCGTLGPQTPAKQVWARIHRMSGKVVKATMPVLKNKDIEAASSIEKANMCVKAFQEVHNSTSLGEEGLRNREDVLRAEGWQSNDTAEGNRPYNSFFSLKEVRSAIHAGANTTPGQDRISYEMLKHLDDVVLEEILSLFNRIWEEGKLPEKWKHAVVIPILKPGKDPSAPSSYRPIALTAVLCKVMERMVTNRLVYVLETNNHFVNYQNGFRIGRNTLDSIAVLDQDIRKAIINKESVLSVFLDIEKAYDSMWKDGLLIKLHGAGIRGKMFHWIKDFLNNRSIQVRVGGEFSMSVGIENGTPQGSVISPVLFNVMINDIFQQIPSSFGKSLFADDGALWKRGRNINYLFEQVQEAVDQVVQWANKWGFRISTAKSNFMIFGYKRKIPELSISMYGCPLERVKEFKFLGLWMDERLTWNHHISKVISKCEKVINILRSLSGSDWGAERDTLFMIYQAMIRSNFDYGCVIFGAAAKTTLSKLDRVQAKALRVCCGAFRTTSIPALLVEMGEMPLRIRRDKLGLHYWAKLRGIIYSSAVKCILEDSWEFTGKDKKTNFFHLIKEKAESIGLAQVEVSGNVWSPQPVWQLPEPMVDLSLLENSKHITKEQVDEFINDFDQHVHIFTDGSKDPVSGKTGLGVYVAGGQLQQSTRISDKVSVYTAELKAILCALEWIEQSKPLNSLICSDSAAALLSLKDGTSRSRPDILLECLCCLSKIERSGCLVCFVWVPSHSDIEGNEMADALAKESLLRENIDLNIPLGKCECYSICKDKLEYQWQIEWAEEPKGRHFFSLQTSIKSKRWKLNSGRRDDIVLTRLRLGHCGLASGLKVVGKHPDGLCQCGSPETVQHVMVSCRQYTRERQQLFIELSDLGLQSFSLQSIFGTEQNKTELVAKAVLKYLHSSGLYVRI